MPLFDYEPRHKPTNLVTPWTSSQDNEPRYRTMNLVTRQWTSSMNLVTRQWTSLQDNKPRHKTMNLVTRSPGGVPWTQKLIESPSAENPELQKVPSVKAWSRLEYSFACLAYCQEVCLSTPGQSTSFSLELSKVPRLYWAWSRPEYGFACLAYCREVCLSTTGQSTSFSLELSKVPLLC